MLWLKLNNFFQNICKHCHNFFFIGIDNIEKMWYNSSTNSKSRNGAIIEVSVMYWRRHRAIGKKGLLHSMNNLWTLCATITKTKVKSVDRSWFLLLFYRRTVKKFNLTQPLFCFCGTFRYLRCLYLAYRRIIRNRNLAGTEKNSISVGKEQAPTLSWMMWFVR